MYVLDQIRKVRRLLRDDTHEGVEGFLEDCLKLLCSGLALGGDCYLDEGFHLLSLLVLLDMEV